jgi:hypothetical protein
MLSEVPSLLDGVDQRQPVRRAFRHCDCDRAIELDDRRRRDT